MLLAWKEIMDLAKIKETGEGFCCILGTQRKTSFWYGFKGVKNDTVTGRSFNFG